MCTSHDSDLEEIPLDDDDSNSIEFKILAFYAKHHVFIPAVRSPKLPRTRSLSQKGLGSWSTNDPWTLVPRPPRSSQSSDKSFAKKSSWRILFGGGTQEDVSTEVHAQGLHQRGPQRQGLSSQLWSRSLSNEGQCTESEALNPRVASIANRVAEIVHSWPPPEDNHTQGGGFKFKEIFVLQGGSSALVTKSAGASAKKDEEDQIIAKIVELLKYSGDQLDIELRKDRALMSTFQNGLSYSVFKTITDKFLTSVDTRGESEVKAWGFKAALAIDVAGKLTAIDNHPMNRVLGFGTKYLQENFSPWIQQHGGWEKVFGISNEEID